VAPSAEAYTYWTDSGSDTIRRANLDGSGVDTAFITGVENPEGVAVDGAHIYWSNSTADTIGRANLDGTAVEQDFVINADGPAGVAVDGTHVYWANGLGRRPGVHTVR
jgi:sugar lactone lactonase YvrE